MGDLFKVSQVRKLGPVARGDGLEDLVPVLAVLSVQLRDGIHHAGGCLVLIGHNHELAGHTRS